MRVRITWLGGILLGWQFGGWLASGSWKSIPVSVLIPGKDQILDWLYRLNLGSPWQDLVTLIFAIPLWLLLIGIAASGWTSRQQCPVRSQVRFYYP